MNKTVGALQDLVVLDLTRVLAGPFCSSVLGDMGARVIKIENPIGGDDARLYGPFVNGTSAWFAVMNRSKEGLTLNLKDPEGKRIFLELVKKADIVLENYRPGVMDKLGLGYDVLKEVNDQIIYASVSGFGSYGRYSQRAGYDIVAQAMGGLMSLTGPRGAGPTRSGNAMGDMLAGMNMIIGVLAAVHARSIIGHGQRVDIALVDSIIISLENAFMRYWCTGEIYKRNGNAYATLAPYDTYQAKDGLVVIACGNQRLYERFCTKCAKKPEWVSDERFKDNTARVKNMDDLKEEIESWTKDYTVEEVTNMLLGEGVPAGPVYDISQVVTDKHIAEDRGMFPRMHHPVIGDIQVNGTAIKLMETMPHPGCPAPELGQDNEKVYGELLGITSDEIKKYREAGIM